MKKQENFLMNIDDYGINLFLGIGTRMTRIGWINTNKISENPPNPSHPCSKITNS